MLLEMMGRHAAMMGVAGLDYLLATLCAKLFSSGTRNSKFIVHLGLDNQ